MCSSDLDAVDDAEGAVLVNWYMNVPVEKDGTLGIVDGISAAGLSLTLRAERDVLVLVSNCPQINNPCNGFEPTAVEMTTGARA